MQSNKKSSKDKDGDYAQSFASLSLTDYGDHPARHSDSYGSSYADAYGSSHKQPYPGDGAYSWTAQSSLAPMQSSSAANSGTPGYGSSHPITTTASGSTSGYEYRNESSATPTYSGYMGYDNASVTSSSVPSSSKAHSNWTDGNITISRQRPPNERYQLPCEFHNLTGCTRVFPGDDVQDWMDHVEGHLLSKFPIRLRCWFCSEEDFDARKTSEGDVRSNFNQRMQHIRHHIVYECYRPEQMLRDDLLIKHLLDHNIIDRRTYASIINPTSLPPFPGSRHSSHRSSNHHRRLPQVEEEAVAESSTSSSQQHRFEHRKAHGSGYHRARRSKLAARHEYPSERISAPAVDHPDDAVLRFLGQLPNSLYSSSRVLGNISIEGSSVSSRNTASRYTTPPSSLYSSVVFENTSPEGYIDSSRNTASKHSEDESVGHAGEETIANIVADELHQNDSELVREASDGSPGLIDPPRSQDRSDDGSSSCPTDTSTPESDSFWLAEYSEDENKKLDEGHVLVQFRGLAVERVFEAFRSWQGDLSEDDRPCDGVGGSNATSKQDKGKGKDSETGKRKRADQPEFNNNVYNNNNNNNRGPSANRASCSKRRRTSDRQLTFACPYTKKDPMSYRDCYKYKLSRIRDVKQHLARCHRNPLYCSRCMETFETEEQRDGHVREASCALRPLTSLGGITEDQRRQLAKKSASNISPEAQWFAIFDILFPGHDPKPQSPYIDSELLQDITLYQDFLTSRGTRILLEFLAERGAISWTLPNEERDLAAFQQTVLEAGLGVVFKEWLERRSSSSQDSNALLGSGSSSQNTPPSSFNSREGVGSNADHDSGAVAPVTAEHPPGAGSADALSEAENIPTNSADPFIFGEGSGGPFDFEHGGVELSDGSICNVDEMMRLFMHDAEASAEFPPDLG